ncbi:hypothetical protein J122_199 [Marinobacter excellens LAMA 842]|uniref:Uncharacterized protein n=1 Tax=Marinobacter excellens LAMA 842 TaxID=1306954 RepID=A0A137SIA1_9GAMM|nr:hypothetical protein J122_199 [Marinobacter excellens LAMA 842]
MCVGHGLYPFYVSVQKGRKRCCQQPPEPTACSYNPAGDDVGRNFSAFRFIIEIYMVYFRHFSGEYQKWISR